jgi:glycosyltransferase involved in cell wall biosynthesis
MTRFQDEFQIVARFEPRMPAAYEWALRVPSIRWPREAWYRNWRHRVEKTPFTFRALTAQAARQLHSVHGQYDVILQFGSVFDAAASGQVPTFVFADFCRWLSSRNTHDEVCHFRTASDEARWLARERAVYSNAARVFVGSEFVRRALIEHYDIPAHRVIVSGFGAGVGFGEPYRKKFDGRTILYIGKGDFEKKGGHLLLKAFEQVREQAPEATLHVVGQDRLPTMPGVVNHGFVRDRDKIVALMRAAHVFTLPSLVDRNPITVLEAMAAFTPCVVSDYAAIPELLGAGGLTVPCNDRDALARALVTILRDAQLAAHLGAAGRARFERQYNWNTAWEIIRREMRAAVGRGH